MRAFAGACERGDAPLAKRRRPRKTRKRRRANGVFKPISIEDTCKLGNFSRAHFYRIEDKLEVTRDGRKVFVNEHSVQAYLRRPR